MISLAQLKPLRQSVTEPAADVELWPDLRARRSFKGQVYVPNIPFHDGNRPSPMLDDPVVGQVPERAAPAGPHLTPR